MKQKLLKIYATLLQKTIRNLEVHYQHIHMIRFNEDLKCPNCNEWFSISGIKHSHKIIQNLDFEPETYKCGQCGEISGADIIITHKVITEKASLPNRFDSR